MAQTDAPPANAWDLSTQKKTRINQSGKWEHERLAKISFRVYRHLDDESVISSCQLCPKSPNIVKNNCSATVISENYFILSSTHSGNVHLTDVDSGDCINTIKFKMTNKRIPEVHRSKYDVSTGKIGIACMDGTVGTFKQDGECTFSTKLGGSCMDFDVDKNNPHLFGTVCDIDNSVYMFDTRCDDKDPVIHIKDHHPQTPTSIAFVSGDKIATAGMGGHLKVLDIATRRVLIKIKEDNVISSVTCDPFERRTVVTTSWNKTVKLYDIATGVYRNIVHAVEKEQQKETSVEVPYFAHTGCVSCSAFLNQEYLVTGGYDRHGILWTIGKNNSLTKRLDLRGHGDWVTGIDGTHDARVVLSSSRDATIRLWNLDTALKSNEKDA